ncbi:aromatic-ring-hydroxylating dioxygenase subunit beta [Saccharopolyspora sp. K220]|uniref:aromatic-ring-hydroxylating dioxygenase subunit beta n=1 Tax=Saccharopolyspora soli TaxID=2926618 RepID=UPI001F57809B|nr:aromatic-ring-hydroxylating dioxygenase subunit beta [Saccharopolyspora soli]MCI2423769.1 aromatic-ring-hydroxylating dioxygenase subunit beta [Saccharopolyspora soli]
MTASTAVGISRTDVEDFLYAEAELLDSFRLAEWLELFTDDATYWVPARYTDTDPQRHTSLIYDDRERMVERVWRLTEGPAHAQIPPSATRRLITNVRITERGDDHLTVRSNFAIFEVRKGEQRAFAGEYEHVLVPGGARWAIRSKKALLVNREAHIFNLTFMI